MTDWTTDQRYVSQPQEDSLTLRPSASTHTWLSYPIFFLSGAAALIYEVSWQRQIGLLFGHTVFAAAIILASYFAGLAIGYLVGARWCRRMNPLRGYALSEVVAATWACAVPAILHLSESSVFFDWLRSPSIFWQAFGRGLFGFILLLPATTALGATLPMMAEFVSRNRSSGANSGVPGPVSMIYAVNTVGALIGVVMATLSLSIVGVCASSFVAAGISTTSALAALVLAKGCQCADVPEVNAEGAEPWRRTQSSPTLWRSVVVLCGFGTLALQVLYTRMFALVFHNSTYTFGAVVAVFLLSLALGAAIVARFARHRTPEMGIALSLLVGSATLLTSIQVFFFLTGLDYFGFGASFTSYLGGVALLVLVIVLPPITVLGGVLPLAWKAAGSFSSTAGTTVGRLTAVNALAASVGALSAGCLLLPLLGLWQSFAAISLLLGAFGAYMLIRRSRHLVAVFSASAILALALLVTAAPAQFHRTAQTDELIRRWQSAYGWIDVVRTKGDGSMKISQDLHYRFGSTGQNSNREYRQAHLPILLHDEPRHVLFLGLGTGLTAGGAVAHPEVQSIDVVELIPEVVDAARLLADYNNSVVDHRNVTIHIDDARHFLLATDRRFDVIVSDLFVPWESQTGYLYTVEHYEVARQRLRRDGLFCQWLPLYQLGRREFELIADSFATVFPRTTIWWGQLNAATPIVALIGTDGVLPHNPGQLASRLKGIRASSHRCDTQLNSPESVYERYACDWLLRNPDYLNTDEHPRVEFLAPISERNNMVLNGTALAVYFDEIFASLPCENLSSTNDSSKPDPKTRRAWQRLILFES